MFEFFVAVIMFPAVLYYIYKYISIYIYIVLNLSFW